MTKLKYLRFVLLLFIPLFFGAKYDGCAFLEAIFFTTCSPEREGVFIASGSDVAGNDIWVYNYGRIYISDSFCSSDNRLITVPNLPNLNDISFFPNLQTGNIIVGDNGILIRLTPDDQLDYLISPAGNHSLNRISVTINPIILYSVGDSGTIIKTTDGGLNWTLLPFPRHNVNLYGVESFDDNNEIVIVIGTDYTTGRSTDGGQTWEISSWTPISPGEITKETERIPKHSSSPLQMSYNTIYFYNDSIGYIGGESGIVGKTTDGGKTWSFKIAEGFDQINSIFFISPDSGVAAGSPGAARFTTDGGNTWFEDESVTNLLNGRDIKRILPLGKNYGIVVSTGMSYFFAPDSTYLDSLQNPTSVESEIQSPKEFMLMQNYPNPFNPETHIDFHIADRSFVTLTIYDILGKNVCTLVNEEKSPGEYKIDFDASGLPSGIYFYRLTAGKFNETKKFVLLK